MDERVTARESSENVSDVRLSRGKLAQHGRCGVDAHGPAAAASPVEERTHLEQQVEHREGHICLLAILFATECFPI